MKFYKNADELIENEVPLSVRAQLYPFFVSGAIAFQEVLNSNRVLFNSSFISNIRGRLLNYLVCRQFESDMISNNFPFSTKAEKVNNFYYKTLNLVRGNVVVNVAKANDTDSLPNKSKYRIKNCRLNRFQQLFYEVRDSKNLVLKTEPYYVFLTYGFKNNEIDFVNLIVPNSSMTKIDKKIDLKKEFTCYESDTSIKHETEKRIITLKNDIQQKLNLKLIKGEGDE